MLTPYQDFLQKKSIVDEGSGFELKESDLNPMLFDFQKAITLWALRKGRSLIGLNCGLGKGPIQLEWLKQVNLYTNKPVIMFAPPGVKTQFKYEAEKFGYKVKIVAEDDDIINGINITNYERLIVREKVNSLDWKDYQEEWQDYSPIELKRQAISQSSPLYEKLYKKQFPDALGNLHPSHEFIIIEVERFRFNPNQFSGIALDEASILKHYGAKTRERLSRFAKNIDFRICATATPAPNDFSELINYVDFLGIMNGKQCRAKYFIQDGNSSSKFRIQKPAWYRWWEFVATWAIMMREPNDLGYENNGFTLPEMKMHNHVIKDTNVPDGMLFAMNAVRLSEQSKVKRNTIEERCQKAAKLANGNNEKWIVWCELNDESALLKKLIPDAKEVVGSHTEVYKEDAFMGFARGEHRVIVTKPSMGGLGMNWQICHNQVFVSIDHSHEKQYQAMRRSWRFGQENNVNIHFVSMNTEGDIMLNVKRKEKQANVMLDEVVSQMDIHSLQKQNGRVKKSKMDYREDTHKEKYWTLTLGDNVIKLAELEDQSIDLVVSSPPFPAMYAYTDSERDIGNYENVKGLIEHLKYSFVALLPKMKPGKVVDLHLAQGVAHLNREGYIGIWDFRGPIIQMMTEIGYILDGEWTIEKDPVTERVRTQTLGLGQNTLNSDPVMMRPSVSDYLIKFRAPGRDIGWSGLLADGVNSGNYDSPNGWITLEMWVYWASNVWYKLRKGMKWYECINVTNVLGGMTKNGRQGFGVKDGRGLDDEKHLCELQLDVIERAVALHSAPGDLVVDLFSGIASTGFQALKMGRRYKGFELKDSYHYTGIKNLQWLESNLNQSDLFSLFDVEVEGDELMQRHKQWMTERGINIHNKPTNWQDWEDDRALQHYKQWCYERGIILTYETAKQLHEASKESEE